MATVAGDAQPGGIHSPAWFPALLVAAGGLAFGLFAMNAFPVGVVHDDARYLVLARSIAQGTGFRITSLPGAPAGTHFPPGFPLLLAALWRLAPAFPANVVLFKLLNAALLAGAALATYSYARLRGGLSAAVSAAVALTFAGTVPVLFLAGLLFSEPLFTAALLLSLLLAERAAGRPTRGRDAPGDVLAFIAGMAGGGVAMIRSIGVAVVIGLCITLLLRRRWRGALAALAGACLFVVPWQLWTMHHAQEIPQIMAADYGTYGRWVAPMLQREGYMAFVQVAAINLRGLRIILTLFGVGSAAPLFGILVAATLLILVAVGLARFARTSPVTVIAVAAYVGAMMIWPWEPDRYVWPLWPLVLTALACGVVQLLEWKPTETLRRLMRVAQLSATGACAMLFLGWHLTAYRSRSWEEPARRNARLAVAVAELASRLPAGLISCEYDALVSLYTGRVAVPIRAAKAEDYLRPLTAAAAAAEILVLLDTYHPRFLLITTEDMRMAAQMLSTGSAARLSFDGVSPGGVVIYVPTVR